jgi:hypothetical protein
MKFKLDECVDARLSIKPILQNGNGLFVFRRRTKDGLETRT